MTFKQFHPVILEYFLPGQCEKAFFPSGEKFAIVERNGNLKIRRAETLELEGEFEIEGDHSVFGVIFPPKGDEEDVKIIAVHNSQNLIFVTKFGGHF